MKFSMRMAILCCLFSLSSVVWNFSAHAEVRYGVTIGENREYPGKSYKRFVAKSLDSCVQSCAKDANCLVYIFNEITKKCSFKSIIGDAKSARGVTSGYKLTAREMDFHEIGTFTTKMKTWESIDLPGGDYDNFSVNEDSDCSNQCLKEDRCKAFTFNRKSRTCWLKSTVSEKKSHASYISGVKLTDSSKTFNEPQPIRYIIKTMRKVDLPGGDYWHFEASKAAKCAEMCLRESRCKAYTFNRKIRTCWLKTSQPAKRSHESYVSGVKLREDERMSTSSTLKGQPAEKVRKSDNPGRW